MDNMIKDLVNAYIYELQNVVIYDKKYKSRRRKFSYFRKKELENFIRFGMLEYKENSSLAVMYAATECLKEVFDNPKKALKYGFSKKHLANMKGLCEDCKNVLSEEKRIANSKLPHIIGFIKKES